ncbi:unnamed protein product [Urochloa humidicola]
MRSSPRIAPSQSNLGHAAAARGCYSRVGVDLSNIYAGILHHLEDRLVPSAAAVDPNVFHLNMEGDYHLYLAERNAAADSTLDANQAAQDSSMRELSSMHPIRLGLTCLIANQILQQGMQPSFFISTT